jgi:hypothetical protein
MGLLFRDQFAQVQTQRGDIMNAVIDNWGNVIYRKSVKLQPEPPTLSASIASDRMA